VALDRWTSAGDAADFLSTILPAGSHVRMLTVVAYQAQWEGPFGRLAFADDAAAQLAIAETAEFEDARSLLEGLGIRVTVGRRYGYPDDEILKEAEMWSAGVILVGHHNREDGWFLGSVTESVVKRARLPVLVIPRLSSGARSPSGAGV
jgi:nucleotide-binding universal stress UspA family protein